jgi:hypothetical protein
MTDHAASWRARAVPILRGRRIVDVLWLGVEQTRDVLHWSLRPPVLVLDSGLALFPAQDPEGNGPGAIMLTDDRLGVLPPVPLGEDRPGEVRARP